MFFSILNLGTITSYVSLLLYSLFHPKRARGGLKIHQYTFFTMFVWSAVHCFYDPSTEMKYWNSNFFSILFYTLAYSIFLINDLMHDKMILWAHTFYVCYLMGGVLALYLTYDVFLMEQVWYPCGMFVAIVLSIFGHKKTTQGVGPKTPLLNPQENPEGGQAISYLENIG